MKKKVFIGLGILVVVIIMIVYNLNKNNEGGTSAFGGKTYDVSASTIETKDISSSVIVTGRVEEINKEEIIFETPLEINEILVSKGDVVSQGERLISVDLSPLQEELDQLMLNYDIQELQLEKVQSLSTTSDTSSLEIAVELNQLSVDSALNLYNDQVENYEKNLILFTENIISQSELDNYAKLVKDAESQLTIAQLNLERSQAELESYKTSNIKSSTSSDLDVEIQMLNLESIRMNIEKLEDEIAKAEEAMISPIDGIITEINVVEGGMANSMQNVMTIVDLGELKVLANIREYDIRDIQLGQQVYISGDAIEEDTTITGRVSYIAPVASSDPTSGQDVTTIAIEIEISEGVQNLKPGYTTDCEVITHIKEKAIIASYEMLKEDKDGSKYVFVIDENKTLKKQYVELGITSDFDIEIISGLSEGDMVVLNPSLILEEGARVNILSE